MLDVVLRYVYAGMQKQAWRFFDNEMSGADVHLVADAYRGAEIQQAITDFLDHLSGGPAQRVSANNSSNGPPINAGSGADLVVFVGHNGLMDFNLKAYPGRKDRRRRDAFVLCCASKSYFSEPLRRTGAVPVLWTNGLMAPEAYVLKAALDGWIAGENGEGIRSRAADAYNKYQRCGLKAARGLFATGW